MKIILSRKGFDSGAGKHPSPILQNGTLVPLPIPDDGKSGIPYGSISANGRRLGPIVQQLAQMDPKERAHLDPDLDRHAYKRRRSWRPLFGARGAHLGHLTNQKVDAGDLFLFFGWFKAVKEGSRFEYEAEAPELHIIFGWLQVEKILRVDGERPQVIDGLLKREMWAKYHPHLNCRVDCGYGSVFMARRLLALPYGQGNGKVAGAGMFKNNSPKLQLTMKGDTRSRSIWHLPSFFRRTNDEPVLTYHSDKQRWHSLADGGWRLESVARGQEFVLDLDRLNEPARVASTKWVWDLISSNA